MSISDSRLAEIREHVRNYDGSSMLWRQKMLIDLLAKIDEQNAELKSPAMPALRTQLSEFRTALKCIDRCAATGKKGMAKAIRENVRLAFERTNPATWPYSRVFPVYKERVR